MRLDSETVLQPKAITVRKYRRNRLAGELGVVVLTTPQIMKRWSELATSDAEELSVTLKRIETLAFFFPPASDPLCAWWRAGIID
jgi:hypothetical protein